jgi:hypothetical protein
MLFCAMQVRMVNAAYVCLIDKPVDNNMSCILHNNCGTIVRKDVPILVDATECKLVEGYVRLVYLKP